MPEDFILFFLRSPNRILQLNTKETIILLFDLFLS